MKSIIYYFTGTGNTLSIARTLAAELGDTTLIPLRRAVNPRGIPVDADVLGIAFPVYFLDMPAVVRDFVRTLRFTGSPYVFGIATCGGNPGAALFNLARLLDEKQVSLSAGFAFAMPGNYLGPIDLMEPQDVVDTKIAAAKERIVAVAGTIRDRQVSLPEGSDDLKFRIGGAITRTLMTSVYRTPRRLHATRSCNRCGTCQKICPSRNISVSENGVHFGKDCIQCYACIHWCPQEAIEIGGRTLGKRRYHHPDVSIRDMLDQRGE